MSRPVRVLFFIGSLKTGGSEAHVATLLEGLDRNVVEPHLMCLFDQGRQITEVRRSTPVHIVNIHRGLVGRIQAWRRMKAILRSVRPDIVHSFGYTCNVYAPLLTAGTRVKVITTRRSLEPSPGKRRAYRFVNRLTTRVLCVSEAAEAFARETEGLSPRRSRVIVNGVAMQPAVNSRSTNGTIRTIGAVGRVHPEKGADLLTAAFARIDAADLQLKIAGPVYTDWGRELVERYSGSPNIRFLGDVDDVPGFLAGLDLFVLPSLSEGMSMALLEAMAVGLPVVATRVGGNPEVLDGGKSGLLVAPDIGELETAIRSLVDDSSLATHYARVGLKRVREDYNADIMLRGYEATYRELMGN